MARLQKLTEYYDDPWVRLRIREYCGETAARPTCVYLSAVKGGEAWDGAPRIPVDALDGLLAQGADVARSMWDRSNMLIHLDIDYQNIDVRDEPYRHPVEMFRKLEPVYQATAAVLRRLGLPLLALITGRGYHFTGRVPLASDAIDRLASIAPETPSWMATLPERRPPGSQPTFHRSRPGHTSRSGSSLNFSPTAFSDAPDAARPFPSS